MAERFRHIAVPAAVVLAIGLAYLLIHELTGFALFCPIRRFLGISCPGCGVSRMFFHLYRLEIAEAFASNCVVFCLLPIALADGVFHAYRYIRYGNGKFCRAEKVCLWVIVGILVVFGVVRNLV